MKLVGITQRVVIDARHGERRDALDQRWPAFLAAAGLGALPLPNDPGLAIRLAAETAIAGLVMTGGNDLAEYGGDAPERDETEASLVSWARSRGLPVLGVCRGMQVIQRCFDVKLERVSGHVTPSHPALVAGQPTRVNSFHNFATRATAPALEAWAVAEDGMIEAVRHEREPLLGVMWHPERVAPFDARDIEMFKAFFSVDA